MIRIVTDVARIGRPAGGRWWVLLLLIAGLSVPTLAWAPDAVAHASLVSSDPAGGARLATAPSRVTVTFDESVGLDLGYLRVVDGNGTDVGVGPAGHQGGQGQTIGIDLQPGLGDGNYIASWRVISADSHPVQGSIRFVVGSAALAAAPESSGPVVSMSTGIAFAAARTVSYAGLALLGGWWLLLTVWPAGRWEQRAGRVLAAGWALAVLGGLAETLLQGAAAAGTGPGTVLRPELIGATLDSNYGRLHVVRLVLLILTGVLLVETLRPGADDPRTVRRLIAGGLVLTLALTFSGSGHAEVADPAWLAVGADMAHLIAMSLWIGGLVLVVVAVLPRREPTELATVLPTFSRVAFGCVLVIIITGTYQAWRETGTVAAITTTTYGQLVLVKGTLLIGLMFLGNLSRLAIQRRYVIGPIPVTAGAGSGNDQGDPAEVTLDTRRMRRSVLGELLLAALVLSVTGFLVSQPPGQSAVVESPPASASTVLDAERSVSLTVDPGRHGAVSVDLTLTGGAVPEQVTVDASLPPQQLGPLPVPLVRSGASTYHAEGVLLPAAGQWTFTIAVRISEFDAVTTNVPISIS